MPVNRPSQCTLSTPSCDCVEAELGENADRALTNLSQDRMEGRRVSAPAAAAVIIGICETDSIYPFTLVVF